MNDWYFEMVIADSKENDIWFKELTAELHFIKTGKLSKHLERVANERLEK